ncbi:MAG: hypothetical protein WKG00_36130 [Polyangiaceae bacterium]
MPVCGALRDTRGAHLVEYLLVAGLVAIMAIAGFRAFGTTALGKSEALAACVESFACAGSAKHGDLGARAAAGPSAADAARQAARVVSLPADSAEGDASQELTSAPEADLDQAPAAATASKGLRIVAGIGGILKELLGVGSAQAAEPLTPDQLRNQLTAKCRRNVDRWDQLMVATNTNATSVRARLPVLTALLNARIREQGFDFTVTQEELAANFLGEGGETTVSPRWGEEPYFSGFGSFGIDTLGTDYAVIRPWLTENIQALENDPNNWSTHVNEKGGQVVTLASLTAAEGLDANAFMYAYMKARAARDMEALGLGRMQDLDRRAQVFWATLYFNMGPNGAKAMLRRHGVDLYKTMVGRGRPAQYNTQRRVAGFELMATLAGNCQDDVCP